MRSQCYLPPGRGDIPTFTPVLTGLNVTNNATTALNCQLYAVYTVYLLLHAMPTKVLLSSELWHCFVDFQTEVDTWLPVNKLNLAYAWRYPIPFLNANAIKAIFHKIGCHGNVPWDIEKRDPDRSSTPKTLSFGEKIAKISPADPDRICLREVIKDEEEEKRKKLRKVKYI